MNILITGGSSSLAKIIGQELSDYKHRIVYSSSKHTKEYLFFDLTKNFPVDFLDPIDCVIHIAKNPKNEFNEIEKNFLQTCLDKNLNVFYLGSTSSYLEAPNEYGKYKKSVENFILKQGGISITCGLIYGKSYVGQLSKIQTIFRKCPFGISIKGAKSVYLTPIDSIPATINEILANNKLSKRRVNLFFPKKIEFSQIVSDLIGRKNINFSVHTRFISSILSLLPIRLNQFNLDRLNGLMSDFTPELYQSSEDYTNYVEMNFIDNFYSDLTKDM